MVVKKDARLPKHPDMAVPNLSVMNITKSLKSRGYVTEQFNWQYYYFYLTDEGILFLRNYLHMPETVVPATIAKANAGGRRQGGAATEEGTTDERRQRDGEYRRGGWRGKQQQQAPVATA